MTRRFDHFIRRCEERGIASVDPVALALELQTAIRTEDHRYVEKVFTHQDTQVWRFRLPVEGIFYAVVTHVGHRILTLLTKEMLRTYKDVRSGKARSIKGAEHYRLTCELERQSRGVRRSTRRCKI